MKLTTKLFALFILAALMTSSCKKDDDTKPSTLAENIIGTWNATSYTSDGVELIPAFFTSASVAFKADKTATITLNSLIFGNSVDQVTYTVDEAAKTVTTTDVDGENTLIAVSIDGNKITLTDTDSSGVVSIFKGTKQ